MAVLIRCDEAHDARQYFRLAIAQRSIIRKSHPERYTQGMQLLTRKEQAAAGNVLRLR